MNADQFKFDEDEGFWRARIDNEFDLYVSGSETQINENALSLAANVTENISKHVMFAIKYINEFVDRVKAEIEDDEPGVINVYCGHVNNCFKVELQFSGDIYGLWSIEFAPDPLLGYCPFSFGRKSW